MKTGIMGGTFDPVHLGHIEMAEFCKKEFSLDRIMFLPLGDAPHKKNVTDKNIRLEMLFSATEGKKDFFVSTLETDRVGKTYTYDTLKILTEDKRNEYSYIIGADTAEVLLTWYRAKDVFKMTDFIVVGRHDCALGEGALQAEKAGAVFRFANHTGLDISSTEIRRRVKMGENAVELVGETVFGVIKKYGLYAD